MSELGELVVVIGDFHIPQREIDIPEKFKELLIPSKIQHIICTGNIGNRETREWLETLAANKANTHIVKGDIDEFGDLPERKVVQLGEFKFGIIHGHQVVPWGDQESLANIQRELDCDILIHGHTHKNKLCQYDAKHYINPGSATGAYSALAADVIPSFMLMVLQGSEIIIYVYEIIDDKLMIDKTTISKADKEEIQQTVW